jgi:chaperonin GroEL
MSKHYESGRDLQEKILEGVNILADNVASTFGPCGRNVILHKKEKNPFITKDGVTVAEFVNLEDYFKNAGAQIIKQAARQTNMMAGDGTTTATILARNILRESQKYLAAGVNPTELKRGMDEAAKCIVSNLKKIATPLSSQEDVRHIATVSANGDKSIGNLIAMAIDQAGKDGAIKVEEAKSMTTSLNVVEGFRFDSGYFAKAFVNDERREACKYDNPLILVTDHKVELVEDILPVLEIVARDSRPLVIVAEEVEGQALAALIMNVTRGTLKVSAVKAPSYGEERRSILKDLCISVGAEFISRESGIKLPETKLKHLGSCKSIEVLKTFTTIVGGIGKPEEIEERIENLKAQIDETDALDRCEKIQDRITRLASGVAVINVGAPTEVEMIEKKHRIEDALEAVRSAQEEGVVPGGGVALIRASKELDIVTDNDDQRIGVDIILRSACAPLMELAKNANLSADLLLEKINNADQSEGYNFAKDEMVDMFKEGIIDPVKVTRVALQNAVSVSSVLLTTNYAIVES